MKKNKKILTVLCCGFLSLVVALTSFLTFKMGKIRPHNVVASADEVVGEYAFSGSPLLLSYSYYDYIDPIYHDSPITNITSLLKISFTVNSYTINYQTARYQSIFFTSSGSFSSSRVSEKWTRDTGSSLTWWNVATPVGNTVHSFSTFTRVGVDFNADVRGVYLYEIDVGNGVFRDQNDPNNHSLIITYIRYFGVDSEGNYDTTNFVEFAFVRSYSALDTSYLTPRYYWFELANRDSEQYRLGREEGLAIGRVEYYQPAYDEGYHDGRLFGDAEGYQRGVGEANDYSFLSLMTAVSDAPIQTLRGIFDFNILGFNMYQFVCSILTICVVVFVIKLFV